MIVYKEFYLWLTGISPRQRKLNTSKHLFLFEIKKYLLLGFIPLFVRKIQVTNK